LYSPNENIQRVTTGLLCELAADKEGAEMIEQEGAREPLTKLIHSTNEGVSTYATALLMNLSDDKQTEKRFSAEIAGSMFRDDPITWNEPHLDDLGVSIMAADDGFRPMGQQQQQRMQSGYAPQQQRPNQGQGAGSMGGPMGGLGRPVQQGFDRGSVGGMSGMDMGVPGGFVPMDIGPQQMHYDSPMGGPNMPGMMQQGGGIGRMGHQMHDPRGGGCFQMMGGPGGMPQHDHRHMGPQGISQDQGWFDQNM